MQVTIEHDGHTITADTLEGAKKELASIKRKEKKAAKAKADAYAMADSRALNAFHTVCHFIDAKLQGKRRGWTFAEASGPVSTYARDEYHRLAGIDEEGARIETDTGYANVHEIPDCFLLNGACFVVAVRYDGARSQWLSVGVEGDEVAMSCLPDFLSDHLDACREEYRETDDIEETTAA